jgi:hypothetical protein
MARTAKDEIFKFLAERPGNLSACAKNFGTTRDKIQEVLDRYPDDARAAMEAHLDEIEEQVYLSASGGGCRKDFKMNEALKLLALRRPKSWGGKVIKSDDDLTPPPEFGHYQSTYVIDGEHEYIQQKPIVEREQTVIRVEDAPGRFFEDSFAGRDADVPGGEEDRGDDVLSILCGDVPGDDKSGDGLG